MSFPLQTSYILQFYCFVVTEDQTHGHANTGLYHTKVHQSGSIFCAIFPKHQGKSPPLLDGRLHSQQKVKTDQKRQGRSSHSLLLFHHYVLATSSLNLLTSFLKLLSLLLLPKVNTDPSHFSTSTTNQLLYSTIDQCPEVCLFMVISC